MMRSKYQCLFKKKAFLILPGYDENLKNVTGYLLFSVQPEILASLGVNCPAVPLSETCCQLKEECVLWGRGGAEARRRSDSAVVCKAWPSFGSGGALSILGVIVFMKKPVSAHIFLLPFAWRLRETMKK